MAGSLPFERVKKINQKYIDVVFGYTRKCQALLPSNNIYYHIHESIQYSILLFFYTTMESNILYDQEIDELLTMFEQQNKFKELGDSYAYNLLYASYRDGIGEKIFKEICHNKGNLLCLIETKKSRGWRGNVYGGYTSKGWNGNKQGCQSDDKAFIFSIRSNRSYPAKIFNVIKAKRALYNTKGYYLMFGQRCCYYTESDGKTGGTYNKANLWNSEYQSIPYDGYLTGNPDSEHFDVKSIEVFQIWH